MVMEPKIKTRQLDGNSKRYLNEDEKISSGIHGQTLIILKFPV